MSNNDHLSTLLYVAERFYNTLKNERVVKIILGLVNDQRVVRFREHRYGKQDGVFLSI